MNENVGTIAVEVAYALAENQKIVTLQVKPGTTALEAVIASGIDKIFPEINVDTADMGVFSNVLGTKGLASPDTYQMQAHDRVEIYRPLIADPKEVRKRRAAEKKNQQALGQ